MANTELHPCRSDSFDDRVHFARRGAERLFAEDVLAGLGRRHDLRGMMLVRRRQDDRPNIRAFERILEAGSRLQSGRLGYLARCVDRLDAEHGPNDFAGGKLTLDDAAPPAEADDGRFDHLRALTYRGRRITRSAPPMHRPPSARGQGLYPVSVRNTRTTRRPLRHGDAH